MTRLFIIAALFCFAVPTALAVPPAGKGKRQSSEASSQAVERVRQVRLQARKGAELLILS